NVPDQEFINDVIAVAKKHRKNTVTIQQYLQYGNYHPNTLKNRFRSWSAVLKKAGLKLSWTPMDSDELLFKNLEAVWLKLGAQPKYKQMKEPLSKYSNSTYLRRFGSWKGALRKFVEYQNSKSRGSAKVEKKIKNTRSHGGKRIDKTKITPRDISLKLRFSVFL